MSDVEDWICGDGAVPSRVRTALSVLRGLPSSDLADLESEGLGSSATSGGGCGGSAGAGGALGAVFF